MTYDIHTNLITKILSLTHSLDFKNSVFLLPNLFFSYEKFLSHSLAEKADYPKKKKINVPNFEKFLGLRGGGED